MSMLKWFIYMLPACVFSAAIANYKADKATLRNCAEFGQSDLMFDKQIKCSVVGGKP